MHLADRKDMVDIAERWISLWTLPVDREMFDLLHADDFEGSSSAGRPNTKEGFAQGLRELIRAFPDLNTTIDDLVVDTVKRRIAIRWSATGTNRVRFLDVGPTHEPTRLTGIEIIEVQGGKIV